MLIFEKKNLFGYKHVETGTNYSHEHAIFSDITCPSINIQVSVDRTKDLQNTVDTYAEIEIRVLEGPDKVALFYLRPG